MIDLNHEEAVVVSDVLRRVLDGAQTGEQVRIKHAVGFTFKPEFTSALEKINGAVLATRPAAP